MLENWLKGIAREERENLLWGFIWVIWCSHNDFIFDKPFFPGYLQENLLATLLNVATP